MVLLLGEGDSNRPKTPTLKEMLKNDPKSVKERSIVKFVFFPNFAPNYSVIVADDYRVNVHKSSKLYPLFNDKLSVWAEQGVCLLVLPNLEVPGTFGLGIDETGVCDWIAAEWGYRLELTCTPTAIPKVTRK